MLRYILAVLKANERKQIKLLAQFRYEIRRFLHFSEQAAAAVNLQPQQHQLLLQIAGASDEIPVTISYVAERLGLRHHTAVELSKRCEIAGLLRKTHDSEDRRCVVLKLTEQGQGALRQLSETHARQLRELAPNLIGALKRIRIGEEEGSQPSSNTRARRNL